MSEKLKDIKLQTVCCEICGKPIVSGKAKSNVTRFLSSESRCQCIFPKAAETAETVSQKQAANFAERPNAVKLKVAPETPDPDAQSSELSKLASMLPEHFTIVSILGEGGMGLVLKILDSRDQQFYAVKVLRTSFLGDEATRKRFEKEAKAATLLHHVGIVAAKEYGVAHGQVPYLVMEYAEGQSLAEHLAAHGSIPIALALDIFIQIAEALKYAHAHGVVHRDVKPSNVMLCVHEETGDLQVKLVDFGIARIVMSGHGTACSLTQTGEIFGSPHYMSPEQCLGQESDAASDIYAFSCLMYECVTGRTPFTGTNSVKLILQHLEEVPPLITDVLKHQKWFRKIGPLKREQYRYLSLMLAHGLEKDRAFRYDSSDYVLQQLRNCAKGNMRLYYIQSSKRVDVNKRVGKYASIIGALLVVLCTGMLIGYNQPAYGKHDLLSVDDAFRETDATHLLDRMSTLLAKGSLGGARDLREFASLVWSKDRHKFVKGKLDSASANYQQSAKHLLGIEYESDSKVVLERLLELARSEPFLLKADTFNLALSLPDLSLEAKSRVYTAWLKAGGVDSYRGPSDSEIADLLKSPQVRNQDGRTIARLIEVYAQAHSDPMVLGASLQAIPQLKGLGYEYRDFLTRYVQYRMQGAVSDADGLLKQWRLDHPEPADE